jgi:hypothetical protein
MGKMVYRGCVAVREWGERERFYPVVSLGKLATAIALRLVRAGNGITEGRRGRFFGGM